MFSGSAPRHCALLILSCSAWVVGAVPPFLLSQYLARIQSQCPGQVVTTANLSVSTTYNAAQARYRGYEFTVGAELLRNLSATAEYGIQSASVLGVPDSILASNFTIVNGSQVSGVPLRVGQLQFEYAQPHGIDLVFQGNYQGPGNSLNRPTGYWFANASISQTFHKNYTVLFGVQNLFNSVAQEYGYFGLGTFYPENKFGTDQNAFDQGTEEFGLPYRQFWLTLNVHI